MKLASRRDPVIRLTYKLTPLILVINTLDLEFNGSACMTPKPNPLPLCIVVSLLFSSTGSISSSFSFEPSDSDSDLFGHRLYATCDLLISTTPTSSILSLIHCIFHV